MAEEKRIQFKKSNYTQPGDVLETRNGKHARIVCVDVKNEKDLPIMALVEINEGYEVPCIYHEDGTSPDANNNFDLFYPEQKISFFVNIFGQPGKYIVKGAYYTKERAEKEGKGYFDYVESREITIKI